MKNHILPGEVKRELDRRDRLAALKALPGMIELVATGILIGFLAGLALNLMK